MQLFDRKTGSSCNPGKYNRWQSDLRRADKQRVHSKGDTGRGPIKRRPRRSNTWVESSDERMKGPPPIKSARSEREESQKRFPSDARCCAQISIRPRIGGTKGVSDTTSLSVRYRNWEGIPSYCPVETLFREELFVSVLPRELSASSDLLYHLAA